MWKLNKMCPNCGKEIEDPTNFQCCEFGNSYCSWACAKEYVNKNYKENEPEDFDIGPIEEDSLG